MSARAITKYGWIGYTAARSSMAYGGEVLTRSLFMGVITYTFMCLWSSVYAGANSQKLGHLTLRQLLWYLMITESITLSSIRIAPEIDEDVRTGRIAVQMLRPWSYGLSRLAQNLGERTVRFVVTFTIGIVVASLLAGSFEWSATGFVMFVILLPAAFVIDFLAYYTIGLFAFWFESTAGLTLIYSRLTMLLGGMLLPLDIYPEVLQPLVKMLPFSAMVYGPARVFVSASRPVFWRSVALQLTALLMFAGMALLVQRCAVRRIQSNGG